LNCESYIFQEGLVDGFCACSVTPQTVLCALPIFESYRISQIHPKPLQMYFREPFARGDAGNRGRQDQ